MPFAIDTGLPTFALPQVYADLTPFERRAVREQYACAQDGKCHFCGEPLTSEPSKKVKRADIKWRLFPPNFQTWPVHLHHSHKTGLTIGAVHMRCNAYLWQYEGE